MHKAECLRLHKECEKMLDEIQVADPTLEVRVARIIDKAKRNHKEAIRKIIKENKSKHEIQSKINYYIRKANATTNPEEKLYYFNLANQLGVK